MKRKYVWIGAAIVVVAGIAAGAAVRGARREAAGGPDRQGRPAEDRPEGQRHREDPAQDPGQDQRRREREDHTAGRGRGAVGREGDLPRRARPRALHRRGRERRGECPLRRGATPTLVQQNMDRTEKEFKRSQELMAGRAWSPQSTFETKESAYPGRGRALQVAPRTRWSRPKAALKQARDDLSKTTIYAPMAGHHQRPEQGTGRDRPRLAVPEGRDPGHRRPLGDGSAGQRRRERHRLHRARPGGRDRGRRAARDGCCKGSVSEIANSANVIGAAARRTRRPSSRSRSPSPTPPQSLRPGMTASADIITKTNDSALSVPLQSVAVRTLDQLAMKGEKREDAEKRYKADKDGFVEIVFRIEKGKAVATQVKTGIQSDDFIEILDGLDRRRRGRLRQLSRHLPGPGERRRGDDQQRARSRPDGKRPHDQQWPV